jgi:hypothetical protein
MVDFHIHNLSNPDRISKTLVKSCYLKMAGLKHESRVNQNIARKWALVELQLLGNRHGKLENCVNVIECGRFKNNNEKDQKMRQNNNMIMINF